MKRSSRIRILGSIAAAALLGGAAGALLFTAPASAVTVSVAVELGELAPGRTSTGAAPVTIDRDSIVTTAHWDFRSDSGTWQAQLCGSEACIPVEDLLGSSLSAGDYVLEVALTVPDVDLSAGTRLSANATGVIGVIEAPSNGSALAVTGMTSTSAILIGAGIAAAVVGLLLTLRRKTQA